MRYLPELSASDRAWARHLREEDPTHFARLPGQHPTILWISRADSRVPRNSVVGLQPAEIFVHRNVGTILAPGDVSVLSVLRFAVEFLAVEHVVICGHYGCGGVRAAFEVRRPGPSGSGSSTSPPSSS